MSDQDPSKQPDRRARLARALKENLRRRKAQRRARSGSETPQDAQSGRSLPPHADDERQD